MFFFSQMSSNVVAPASLVEVFEALLSSAATTVDDEKGNPAWQPRADFYVFCILASLPWAGLDLSEVFLSSLDLFSCSLIMHSALENLYILKTASPCLVTMPAACL